MKKKAIEKIPYLELPKVSRKKEVKYIGVTAVKIIAHEKHFFLEVYRNKKNERTVPLVRIVCTKKDFGTFFPDGETWSRSKCEYNTYSDGLIWEDEKTYNRDNRRKQNALYSEEDLQRLKNFFKDTRVYNDADWWEYISRTQKDIISTEWMEREKRKNERRQQALREREENTPPLPEEEMLSWADRVLFKNKHFLYYRKKGRKATVCCSACGGVNEGYWKTGDSFESCFYKKIEEPREKFFGTCGLCGAYGTYKPQGKAKNTYSMETHVFKSDRYKEKGAVIRYVQLEKKFILDEMVDEKGEPVMTGAFEELSGIEIARTYIDGKKVQTDYHKQNPYTGIDFWDDCNLYGMSNIKVEEAPLYPGFSKNLEGTILQYSAIELYEKEMGRVNAREYMVRYMETPQIEMLVKLNLFSIVEKLLKCHYGIVADNTAERPDKFLGIRKERVKMLMEKKGEESILDILKIEKRMNQNWTEEQIRNLAEIGANQGQIERAMKFMNIQKILNTIANYAGCQYGTGCSNAIDRLRHTATTYFDYLYMREQLGYNLQNTVYQKPKNLEVAHNKMMNEIDKEKMDKRLMEVAENYPMIRKNYRKLRNRYFYEDDNFIIRPARSAEEIVQEGRILHHCVGGDNYLTKHNAMETVILLLRFKENPEIPYITIEIQEERILQWYGAHDKKPDEKNMKKWIDAYVTRLKCERYGIGKKAEEEVMVQLMALA